MILEELYLTDNDNVLSEGSWDKVRGVIDKASQSWNNVQQNPGPFFKLGMLITGLIVRAVMGNGLNHGHLKPTEASKASMASRRARVMKIMADGEGNDELSQYEQMLRQKEDQKHQLLDKLEKLSPEIASTIEAEYMEKYKETVDSIEDDPTGAMKIHNGLLDETIEVLEEAIAKLDKAQGESGESQPGQEKEVIPAGEEMEDEVGRD